MVNIFLLKRLFPVFLILVGCKFLDSELLYPTDEEIIGIIKNEYAKNNQLDGSEFLNVDTVYITSSMINAVDSTCIVTYHINGTYQPAAQPSSIAVHAPPSLNADSSLMLVFKNKKWCLKE